MLFHIIILYLAIFWQRRFSLGYFFSSFTLLFFLRLIFCSFLFNNLICRILFFFDNFFIFFFLSYGTIFLCIPPLVSGCLVNWSNYLFTTILILTPSKNPESSLDSDLELFHLPLTPKIMLL